jgi:pentatricopeptide repeat protein
VAAINALISACGRGRRPDLSLATFNDMKSRFSVTPGVRSYRSAIIACNQAEHERARRKKAAQVRFEEDEYEPLVKWWECAMALLRRMREEGQTPDMKIFSSVISACEAAGEWQRALGVLQMILDEYDTEDGEEVWLNSYCFNAAISACEKGGAWVEALELYERMLDMGGSIKPNFVTLSSLIVALDKAGQKELALSKYVEGRELGIVVDPWRWTRTREGSSVYALVSASFELFTASTSFVSSSNSGPQDLHRFSAAMAKVALRSALDSSLAKKQTEFTGKDLVIITGIGHNRATEPILKSITLDLLSSEYQITAKVDPLNPGRVVLDSDTLLKFVNSKSWV